MEHGEVGSTDEGTVVDGDAPAVWWLDSSYDQGRRSTNSLRLDRARRLRGQLVAPVTVWTAGHPPGGAGLTVSSALVAEGRPARLLGLIDPTSAFWEAEQETGAFVVHVLGAGDRALAERFSKVRPPIRGPFERLEVAESPPGA